MYYFDTHVHTSEVSPCGFISAEETVRLYKDAGYSGICITDHYNKVNVFDAWECHSWEQTMDRFLSGYHNAKDMGDKLGVDVLLGVELTFCDSPNDYLLFGITEDFLYTFPELYDYGLESFYKLAKEHNILVFQAHPFRVWCDVADPCYLDGIEIVNGNIRHDSQNHLAAEFAKKHNLLISAGSDCHRPGDEAKSGIRTKSRIENIDMLKHVFINKELEIISIDI